MLLRYFFAEAGFPCPTKRNPSTIFYDAINSDFDVVNSHLERVSKTLCTCEEPKGSDAYKKFSVSEIKATLAEKYKCTDHETSTITTSQAGWWKQLTTLTRRSCLNMSRDIGYYWLRLIIYSVVSIMCRYIYSTTLGLGTPRF
ncbi:hypothetical protein HanRHA438_Chr15g0716491 [Helianthus annuus]|nr:hypothetical protein HanRHA438_Chr15g0716491 [Helianthus annuus]